jgi:Fis family transcriptional regulator
MSKKNIEECVRDKPGGVLPRPARHRAGCACTTWWCASVEKPLLDVVMQHAGHNQSRAAEWLGMNRNTLRKKLLEHEAAP